MEPEKWVLVKVAYRKKKKTFSEKNKHERQGRKEAN